MHGFVSPNIYSAKIKFDPAKDPVNHDAHWPSISEMVAEARKTGQLPFSNLRHALPTHTEDIDGPDLVFTDKIDSVIKGRAMAEEIKNLENLRDQQLQQQQSTDPNPPQPAA